MDYNILTLPTHIVDGKVEVLSYAPYTFLVRTLCAFVLLLAIMPLLLLRDLSALRYFSMASLVIIMYIIGVATYQCPKFVNKYRGDPRYIVEWGVSPLNFDWFTGFSTVVVSYMCHPTFFYVRSELLNPSKPRVKKVLAYSIAIETTIYLIISIAGYISLGDYYMVDLFALRPRLGKELIPHHLKK